MKLRGEVFETLEELGESAEELLDQITPERMEWVDGHWIERLDRVIKTNSDDIETIDRQTDDESTNTKAKSPNKRVK
jgi:hypothetical protein